MGCDEIQKRVAAQGAQALASDPAARAHVVGCEQCLAALLAYGIRGAENREHTQASGSDPEAVHFAERLRRGPNQRYTALLALAAGLTVVVGAKLLWRPRSQPMAAEYMARRATSLWSETETPAWLDDAEGGRARAHAAREPSSHAKPPTRNRFGIESPTQTNDPDMTREAARQQAASAGILGVLRARRDGSQPTAAAPTAEPEQRSDDTLGALLAGQPNAEASRGLLGLSMKGTASAAGRNAAVARGFGAGMGAVGTLGRSGVVSNSHSPTLGLRSRGHAAIVARAPAAEPATPSAAPDSMRALQTTAQRAGYAHVESHRASGPRAPREDLAARASAAATNALAPSANPAARLLARYQVLDGIQPIDADGYFENTYVPGDPTLRALQARLAGYDRASLLPTSTRGAQLDDAVHRNLQPFDAPNHAALGLYLSASERGITSERRMLLQVGLQATPRYSGRRPAMNVGIVLDLRAGLDSAQSASVRALCAAFADARDLSDRITLFAAGPGGGMVVAPAAFRHGPLSVALQRLLTERRAPPVELTTALQNALEHIRGADDPNAPLGSSVLIVVAPHALGAQLAELEAIAHDSAVQGVPVSVFGVGAEADNNALSALALAGQGNRRMLSSAPDAAPAVDRELSSVARVVARAVRLRIQLAPGVRLLQVLGSHPLDTAHADRVREAENSIDQRLARNLGLSADRGEDEQGVQIIIPCLYAADSHVILLDVVAAGPGALADVSVRFKDLVQLGNGVARQSIALQNVELARGALQRNVLKNLFAYELAQQLSAAGDAVEAGVPAQAKNVLNEARALLDGVPGAVPELAGDRELSADRALLGEYNALLSAIRDEPQRAFTADSLHFASLIKLQPRPEWDARAR